MPRAIRSSVRLRRVALYVCVSLWAVPGVAQVMADPPSTGSTGPAARGPSLADALQAANVAVKACAARGMTASASVVDSAGVLKALIAADGAREMAVVSSQRKALTAVAFRMPTSELREKLPTSKALADRFATNSNYRNFAGGVPLYVGDVLIGAIGVSGATDSNVDEMCAHEGLKAIATK